MLYVVDKICSGGSIHSISILLYAKKHNIIFSYFIFHSSTFSNIVDFPLCIYFIPILLLILQMNIVNKKLYYNLYRMWSIDDTYEDVNINMWIKLPFIE